MIFVPKHQFSWIGNYFSSNMEYFCFPKHSLRLIIMRNSVVSTVCYINKIPVIFEAIDASVFIISVIYEIVKSINIFRYLLPLTTKI